MKTLEYASCEGSSDEYVAGVSARSPWGSSAHRGTLQPRVVAGVCCVVVVCSLLLSVCLAFSITHGTQLALDRPWLADFPSLTHSLTRIHLAHIYLLMCMYYVASLNTCTPFYRLFCSEEQLAAMNNSK